MEDWKKIQNEQLRGMNQKYKQCYLIKDETKRAYSTYRKRTMAYKIQSWQIIGRMLEEYIDKKEIHNMKRG